MPKVIYISATGQETSLEVAINNNLMNAAIFDNVEGIEGMCGGCLACATCHVYVDKAWSDKLPPLGEDEDTLLTQVTSERKFNSRLSCQIQMTVALDGIVIHMPAAQ
jgi:ferredoxin, 2Fe-2S